MAGTACLVLTVACAACTTTSSRAPPAARGPGSGSAEITVGSFDFPESVLLAYLYADVLAGRGYPVRVLPDLGTRELVHPALMAGLINWCPSTPGRRWNSSASAGCPPPPASRRPPAPWPDP